MTQDGDRLDRIEAALDRQVAVNADLRTSVTELKTTVTELRTTADALLQVATIHQQNFERLAVELNTDRQTWQAEIRRIWEHLQRE